MEASVGGWSVLGEKNGSGRWMLFRLDVGPIARAFKFLFPQSVSLCLLPLFSFSFSFSRPPYCKKENHGQPGL